jgi:hypothetical protein
MKHKNLLDKIDVKTPCHESWDEMIGSDEVRFCSHCAKNVHDISAMTRQKAEKLVKESNGNLCVRYVKTPTGKLISALPKFTQIRRNATIAASILATSLTFTTLAYAQGEPFKPKGNVTQTNKDKPANSEIKQGFATIYGNIKDLENKPVAEINVVLRDIKTQQIAETRSDKYGFYEFKKVESSIYAVEISTTGFENFVSRSFVTVDNLESENNITLKNTYEFMGDVIFIDDKILPNVELLKLEPIKSKKKKKKN